MNKDKFKKYLELNNEFISDKWESFEEIMTWYLSNAHLIVYYNQFKDGITGGNIHEDICLIAFKLSNIRYSPCTPNSHSAPNGKEENWYGIPDKPIGYHGISFRLDMRFNKTPRGMSSSAKLGNLYHGTGGMYGDTIYGERILWLDDYPTMLQNTLEAKQTWEDEEKHRHAINKLKGRTYHTKAFSIRFPNKQSII